MMGCPIGQKYVVFGVAKSFKNLFLKSLKNQIWEIFSASLCHHFIFMMKILSFF